MTKNKLTGASTIEVTVGLNRDETGAHWIDVKIEGHIDTLDLDQAQKILEQAHQNCPYSKATKGNIDVSVTAV